MQSNTDSLRRSFLHARRAFTALGSLMIASIAFSCTSATAPVTEPTALQKAVSALGGQEALDGLRALSLEGNGTSLVIDEGVAAGDPAHEVSKYGVAVAIDVGGNNMRVSYERDSLVMIPGAKNKFSEITAGNAGYILGNELVFGAAPDYVGDPMSSARWASVRKEQRLSNPQLLLRGLAEADVPDGGVKDVNGRPHHLLIVPDPEGLHEITLLVDAGTGVISGLATMESDHLRGDVKLEVAYDHWETAGGLSVPRNVTISLEGQPVSVEERTHVEVNPKLAASLFSFPEGAKPPHDEAHAHEGELNAQHHQRFASLGTAPYFDWQNTTVVGVEIGAGSGIHHLTGAGHHSLLIDQGDSVVLIEAPLHAARSEAILTWIDKNLAGGLAKNLISHVISTHHHADHSAGLRTFAERGARIVVAEPSKAFMAEVFASPRTLDPDALSKHPEIKPEIDTVAQGGSFKIGNVTAYQIPSKHAGDMLIMHVATPGSAGIVFNSDLYLPDLNGIAPGSIFVQGGKDLAAALTQLGLDDAAVTLLGGHGNIDFATGSHCNVSYADFKAQLAVATGGAGQ